MGVNGCQWVSEWVTALIREDISSLVHELRNGVAVNSRHIRRT